MKISHSSGTYNTPFFLSIESDETVQYSINNGPYFTFREALFISNSCEIHIKTCSGEEFLHVELSATLESPGPIYIIGGADKCAEIHQAIIADAGGAEKARVAFIPAGSANPYAAGMDRMVRFETMAGLKIDRLQVPLLHERYDFSSKENQSAFRIIPVAIIDDPETSSNPVNDPDHVINDEGTYPNINEADWKNGGHSLEEAKSVFENNYNVFFFTGGNQTRYISALMNEDGSDGLLLSVIRWLHRYRGAVIAGTSAGAAGLACSMISGGGSAASWLQGLVNESLKDEIISPEVFPSSGENDRRLVMGPGLSFLPDFMVSDTHFFNRGRHGRLLKAVSHLVDTTGQQAVGIGVAENTAARVHANNITVVGESGIFIPVATNTFSFTIYHAFPGDVVQIHEQEGKIHVSQTTSDSKTLNDNLPSTLCEPDIFAKNRWLEFLFQGFSSSTCEHLFGLSLCSLQEVSADEYPRSDSIMLATFHKNSDFKRITTESITNDFGRKDRNYPQMQINRQLHNYVSGLALTIDIIEVSGDRPLYQFLQSPDAFREMPSSGSRLAVLGICKESLLILHAFFIDYEINSDSDELLMRIDTEPACQANILCNDANVVTDDNGMAVISSCTQLQINVESRSGVRLQGKVTASPFLIIGEEG